MASVDNYVKKLRVIILSKNCNLKFISVEIKNFILCIRFVLHFDFEEEY